MIKLKGQTGSGEWVVFSVSDIEDADRDYTEVRLLNEDNIKYILTSTIQLADDPRKQMLDEIREKINNLTEYKTFVRVEGDPVPTLPQIAKWCVIWILDEMEAKL